MKLSEIPIVQPSEGYVAWVCFLARLCDGHCSCRLEIEHADGRREHFSLFAVLNSALYRELCTVKVLRAFH